MSDLDDVNDSLNCNGYADCDFEGINKGTKDPIKVYLSSLLLSSLLKGSMLMTLMVWIMLMGWYGCC